MRSESNSIAVRPPCPVATKDQARKPTAIVAMPAAAGQRRWQVVLDRSKSQFVQVD